MRLFANNATSSLASGVNDSDNTLLLATGEGARFPAPTAGDHFDLTLTQGIGLEKSWEIVKVTARSGDTLTVTRGQEGTIAAEWTVGSKAELRLTKEAMEEVATGDRTVYEKDFGQGSIQVFDTPGTHTFTPSAAGWHRLTVIGAGGPGRLSINCGGGGGGGYADKVAWLDGTPITVTVGAGSTTTDGGTSSVGSIVSATGGKMSVGFAGGLGGEGFGGDRNITGGKGGEGRTNVGGGGGCFGGGVGASPRSTGPTPATTVSGFPGGGGALSMAAASCRTALLTDAMVTVRSLQHRNTSFGLAGPTGGGSNGGSGGGGCFGDGATYNGNNGGAGGLGGGGGGGGGAGAGGGAGGSPGGGGGGGYSGVASTGGHGMVIIEW